MDRAELSAAIIDELSQLFAEALKRNAARLVSNDPSLGSGQALDGIEQCLQEVGRSVFGRVVEQTVAAIALAQANERAVAISRVWSGITLWPASSQALQRQAA